MSFILRSDSPIEMFSKTGGGKATNMARLSQNGFSVPHWMCVSSNAFRRFVEINQLQKKLVPREPLADFARDLEEIFIAAPLPPDLAEQIETELKRLNLTDRFVAVRSSGIDEDSKDHSFAGQFSSFLFQKGAAAIALSLKKCWASGYSERALSYRIEKGLPTDSIQIGVVIQSMVNADTAGVAFSRNPIHPLDRDSLVVSSVWGLGEGLVSGELDADHFEVHRTDLKIKSTVVEKEKAFRQAPAGGLVKVDVPAPDQKKPSLSDFQIAEVSRLALELENKLGSPQDCEWAYEGNRLYCVQTRPITNLPQAAFFDSKINGSLPILWDNSNIIESYSGVTSPLTFSFASSAYRQVYIQFCEVMGVPQANIVRDEPVFRNMLGLIRGRIYYHLINWYRLILMLPGASSNSGFMETMMGVKQGLKPEVVQLFDFIKNPPRYSFLRKTMVHILTVKRFITIDSIVSTFRKHFDSIYETARKLDFKSMSLPELSSQYQYLDTQVLRRWQAPIINDYLCMIFFGLLKKLTENWVAKGEKGSSLQNDLLCGQGDLESTEPTKMLMRIAAEIDRNQPDVREWILKQDPVQVMPTLRASPIHPDLHAKLEEFLDRYGFRCVNELKLEEPDLHDDPSFVVNAIMSYIRSKSYMIEKMEEREKIIRATAEQTVRENISGLKRVVFFWVLKHARIAVRNRENLRFARTKIFGVVRHIFRAMGEKFCQLDVLGEPGDIFYLTVEEIFAYIEGRSISLTLKTLAEQRRREFDIFRKTPPPPDRFLTSGVVGCSMIYPAVLDDADLLRADAPVSTDPNVLIGTPCCPGVVEGIVRVVKDLKDANGINGEILVTARTDPGWVPIYPSCSALLIERGSLLSHSAVVARELGLPTIVGISGGLMTKLKSGQRVRVDAGKGEVRILT